MSDRIDQVTIRIGLNFRHEGERNGGRAFPCSTEEDAVELLQPGGALHGLLLDQIKLSIANHRTTEIILSNDMPQLHTSPFPKGELFGEEDGGNEDEDKEGGGG